MRPSLPSFSDVEDLLRSIDETHIYSNRGPLVKSLEIEFAEYLGARPEHIVIVANATLALQGLLEVSSVEDWYVPDYTFAATGLAVTKSGKKLHLLDVERETWKVDLKSVTLQKNLIGVIPVMPFGSEVSFSGYEEFPNVILDAAASIGRKPIQASEIKEGWSVVYSLHATKVLGAGEGAIVVCGNAECAENLRAWINFGFQNDRKSNIPGTNAKMSEFNAAYGLASLRRIEYEQDRWLEPQTFVSELSQNRPWATWINSIPAFQPYWIIELENKEQREYTQLALAKLRIESRSWWQVPLSQQKGIRASSIAEDLSIAETLASRHLGLPMYPDLLQQDIREIVETIDRCIQLK